MWVPKRLISVMELMSNLVYFAKSTEKCFKELAAYQQTLQIQSEGLTKRVATVEKRLAAMSEDRHEVEHGIRWNNTH